MKRAAIIVTDADSLFMQHAWAGHVVRATRAEPSEQLLADLLVMAAECAASDIPHLQNIAARVRALLPEDGGG